MIVVPRQFLPSLPVFDAVFHEGLFTGLLNSNQKMQCALQTQVAEDEHVEFCVEWGTDGLQSLRATVGILITIVALV